ncbi:hypothetical protein E2C01_040967 [Portunus trituberculatus]|uniref:Uncharacterized protein n=1 Tax=Portunus trituberculatus TaxID=210409 RepID=A0A5B7FP07_PORTR|nr:hypothetical protein [Portunus trituberculatus]
MSSLTSPPLLHHSLLPHLDNIHISKFFFSTNFLARQLGTRSDTHRYPHLRTDRWNVIRLPVCIGLENFQRTVWSLCRGWKSGGSRTARQSKTGLKEGMKVA